MKISNKRNIYYGLVLVALQNAYFWYAPWLLFLLNYIDLTQVALLQAVGLITTVLTEVPTGAISDLFGKKRTLQIGFLLATVCEFSLAFSTKFWMFLLVWIGQFLAASFYSGTMEAFMFDSLAENNEEKQYPKVISRMQAMQNIATAIATLSGGFMYRFWIGLPFFMTGIFKLISLFVTTFIDEPQVDTDKFSFSQFAKQTKQGFQHLLQPSMLKYFSVILLFGIFMAISYELLDDIAVVDWGYNEITIGIVYTIAIVLAIPTSFLYERFRQFLAPYIIVMLGIILLSINYIFSPWITASVWTLLFFLRVSFSPIRNSAISEILNNNTPSKIRATTLSTYELMRQLPFVVLSVFIGYFMEKWGVRIFSFYFGLSLFVLLCLYIAIIFARRKYLALNNVSHKL